MQITYTLTQEDLFHYYAYALRRARKLRPPLVISLGILMAIIGVSILVFALGKGVQNLSLSDFLSAYFCIFLGFNYVRVYSRWGQKSLIQKMAVNSPTLYLPHTVTIDQEWLHIVTRLSDLRVRWQAVKDVHSDSAYVFLTAGGIVYTIARRNFTDPEGSQRFLSAAAQYWQTAKQMSLETQEGVWPPAPRLGI